MRIRLALAIFAALCLFLTTTDASAQQANPNPAGMLARLKAMDANDDGVIARDEATGLMKVHFDSVDTNSDGKLDRAELTALAIRLMKNRAANAHRPNPQPGASGDAIAQRVPDGVTLIPDIAYREGASEAWRLDLLMPAARGEKPRPAIVFIHGGGWRSGDKRKGIFFDGAAQYAAKGYVCITVNYRLIGEANFPACIEDCKCAVRWIRANAEKYNIDPERIGGYGNSAGAHLVAMLGLTDKDDELEGDGPYQDQSSKLQAVCCSATPTDFLLFGGPEAAARLAERFGISEENAVKIARLYSPITHVSGNAPPMLVVHGTADGTVNIKHGDTLVAALKEAGAKDVEYIRIDGAGHGVFGQHAEKTHPAMEAFFARTIGGP